MLLAVMGKPTEPTMSRRQDARRHMVSFFNRHLKS
jgi:hypothetical protein